MAQERVQDKKMIDVNAVIFNLNQYFKKITQDFPRASRDRGVANETYRIEFEFAHVLNEIARGPDCMLTYNISKANEFLDLVSKQR